MDAAHHQASKVYNLLSSRQSLQFVLAVCVIFSLLQIRIPNNTITNIRIRIGNEQLDRNYSYMRFENNHTHSMRKTNTYTQMFSMEKYPTQFRLNFSESDWEALGIYVLSAITSNTSECAEYARDIKLNSWIDTKRNKERIKCCILWNDNTISKFNDPILPPIIKKKTRMMTHPIVCPFNKPLSDIGSVTLQLELFSCPVQKNMYIRPHFPKINKNQESFAVCLKVVYGNVDNTLFVDWLEHLRLMKVDTIFMYTFNITGETNAIVKRYERIGFVERRYFDYPRKSTIGDLEAKTRAIWEIRPNIVNDCFYRSAGYKFMAVVDMDEFIVPRRHENLKELMKYLMARYPTAAGFAQPSVLFVKDAGPDPTASTNASNLVKYVRRTPVLSWEMARTKNIILPARNSKISTHKFQPHESYQSVQIPKKFPEVTLNHYRMCYDDMKEICSGNLTEDTHILHFVKRFRNNASYPDV